MPKVRLYWICSFVLGLVIIALAGPVLGAFPAASYDLANGYGSAVYAFEMAKTPADLVAVFGPIDDPLRTVRIEQMNRGNLWDFPFMVIYSLYMMFFFLAIWRDTSRSLWLVFAVIGMLSGCADAIENTLLLNITENLPTAPGLEWVAIPVWTKFLSIMLCIFASAVYLLSQAKILWKLLGIGSICGGVMLLAALLLPRDYGYLMAIGTGIGWGSMWLFAGDRSLWHRS